MSKKKKNCIHCNEEISSNLMLCPYCGHRTMNNKSNNKLFPIIFVIAVFSIFLVTIIVVAFNNSLQNNLDINNVYNNDKLNKDNTNSNSNKSNSSDNIIIKKEDGFINTKSNVVNSFVNNIFSDLNDNLILANLVQNEIYMVTYMGKNEIDGEFITFIFKEDSSFYEMNLTYYKNNPKIMEDVYKVLAYSKFGFSSSDIEEIKSYLKNESSGGKSIKYGNYYIKVTKYNNSTLYIRSTE